MEKVEVSLTGIHSYDFERGKLVSVSVKGAGSTIFRRHIKMAAEYYASKLMSRRMVESLHIKVVLKPNLDGNADGICSFEDHDDGVRYFEIEIDKKNSERQVLINLAHEMVHVKQFALGEMKDGVTSAHTYWQGIQISEEDNDYWDLPWEIEAHGREKGLFTRFKHHYGLEGLYKRPTYGDK